MDIAHKQRLVGGLVLVALGLILVPAILDFSQDKPDSMQSAKMPDAPETKDMEVLPLEVWSEPIDPKVDNSEAIVEKPEAAPSPAKQTPPPSKPESQPEPRQQTAKAKPKPKPETAAKAAIPSGASGWVVQVASFSDQSKAFKLRDRLRKAGHPAFIERGRSSSGATIYRVKVGPVLQRTEADRLKQQVDKETKLNSLVMKYR